MKKIVISVLGQDRPGILSATSKALFQRQCNIENVSQTRLQSEFAGIFIVAVPDDISVDTLAAHLALELSSLDLHTHIKALGQIETDLARETKEPFIITTKGPDRAGLVAGVTEILACHRVNVTNLNAVFEGGDDPGKNIMIYEVDVPSDIDTQVLFTSLRERVRELGLTVSIQHRNIFEAINRI